MTRTKKWIIVAASCVLVLAVALTGAYFLFWRVRPSSQSDYPVVGDGDGLDVRVPVEGIAGMSQNAELIIEGTVVKEYEPLVDEMSDGMTPSDAPDEVGGQDAWVNTHYRFDIQVDDVLKGDPKGDVVTISYNDMAASGVPDFQIGDKMIFSLCYNDYWDNYNLLDIHDGLFYIAHDQKVYPVDPDGPMAETSGMMLEDLKTEVRDCVASAKG